MWKRLDIRTGGFVSNINHAMHVEAEWQAGIIHSKTGLTLERHDAHLTILSAIVLI